MRHPNPFLGTEFAALLFARRFLGRTVLDGLAGIALPPTAFTLLSGVSSRGGQRADCHAVELVLGDSRHVWRWKCNEYQHDAIHNH